MSAVTAAPFLFPAGARIGTDNVVLRARARKHSVSEFAGPLSVKTVLSGTVTWMVDRRALTVRPFTYLILPEGQTYSMEIDETRPVETCCVFFAPGFVEGVASDVVSPLDAALDAPSQLPLAVLHRDQDAAGLGRRVQALAPLCQDRLAPSGFEEGFLRTAIRLVHEYHEVRRQAARLPAVRAATRDELYRRLLRGRDVLHGSLAEPVSLAVAARAACLSPFHFHRGFRAAFGRTPHAYLTRLRMEEALTQLRGGATAIQAGLAAGFLSSAAFCRAFRSEFGLPPSEHRKIARSGKKGD